MTHWARTISLGLFLLSYSLTLAQSQTDSLRKKLKQTLHDTIRIETLNRLAQAYLRTVPDSALLFSNQAIALSQKNHFPKGEVEALIHLGYYHWLRSNTQKCLDFSQKALKISDEIGYTRGIARSMINLGISADKQGNASQALEFLFKALPLAEEADDRQTMAICLHSIGIVYDRQENFVLSLDNLKKAFSIWEELNDLHGQAVTLNAMGMVYLDIENEKEAVSHFQEAIEMAQKIGDKLALAYPLNNMGDYFRRKKDYSKALEYYEKSLEIKEKARDRSGASFTYNSLAVMHLEMKNPEKAINAGIRALLLGKTSGHAEEVKKAYEILGKAFYEKADYRRAYDYQALFIRYKDSLFSAEKSKEIGRLEGSFALYRKEKENELLKKDKLLQEEMILEHRAINLAISGGLLSVLILAFVFFRGRQKQKEANDLLILRNEEINQQKEEIQSIADSLREANDQLQDKNEEINRHNEEAQALADTLRRANSEISRHKDLLEKKNQDITSSIFYAKRIQSALLPLEDEISKHIPQHFILYRPRDIVSGDFYWFTEREGKLLIAVADCTGHGVPGAFMSMIGNEILREIIDFHRVSDADMVLNLLHRRIRDALKQEETQTNDGMDIALCVIDKANGLLEFSGAKNPFYYMQYDAISRQPLLSEKTHELRIIKGDNMPIGGHQEEELRIFTRHTLAMRNENGPLSTVCYLFSDGYQDQFGGRKGKKFMTKRFRELLFDIHTLDMTTQHEILDRTIIDWMAEADEKQIDDILVFGMRI
jgi:serine phosphatase RsbU (regulator of sigma subunit)